MENIALKTVILEYFRIYKFKIYFMAATKEFFVRLSFKLCTKKCTFIFIFLERLYNNLSEITLLPCFQVFVYI